ncbi:DUF1801 domain-containing protein [Flavobacterium suzhouense]|uniref:DUF1801 domain-containing protein n=1 Tax=Flavobacterium suzhouense TaxID=1529638 RepID=A0ABW5NTU5_9FLAO
MTTEEQISAYIASLPEMQQNEIQELHRFMLSILPDAKLWFLDGTNDDGKVVTNPNIGYGEYTINYKDGTSRPFYQVGISAKTTGISVYIMGIPDKKHLPDSYGEKLGKAKVTGYCINFKKLKDINFDILETAVKDGVAISGGGN